MDFIKLNSKYMKGFYLLLKDSFSMSGNYFEEILYWKFLSRKKSDMNITYIAIDNDTVVGQYSNAYLEIHFKKQIMSCHICLDMCVSQYHRSKGIISKLSKKVYEEIPRNTFSIGFSNNSGIKVDKNSKGYGYNIIGGFKKILLVCNGKKGGLSFIESKDLSFTDLILTQEDSYFAINKDSVYLNWRYVDKPQNNYKLYKILHDNDIVGFVIGLKKGLSFNVLDFGFTEDIQNNDILNVIKNIGKLNNAYFCLFYVLYNNYWRTFFQEEYLKISYSPKEKHYFTIKIHNNELSNVLNKDSWLLGLGDIM